MIQINYFLVVITQFKLVCTALKSWPFFNVMKICNTLQLRGVQVGSEMPFNSRTHYNIGPNVDKLTGFLKRVVKVTEHKDNISLKKHQGALTKPV